MKRLYPAALALLVMLSSCEIYFDDDDDYDDHRRKPVTTTVAELKNIEDDAHVTMTGVVQKSLGQEWYEFTDDTGSIDVEIDYEVWRYNSLDRKALPMSVEITGELDKERRWMEIDVDSIRKL